MKKAVKVVVEMEVRYHFHINGLTIFCDEIKADLVNGSMWYDLYSNNKYIGHVYDVKFKFTCKIVDDNEITLAYDLVSIAELENIVDTYEVLGEE